MKNNVKEIKDKIKKLKVEMENPYFWEDKNKAKLIIKEIQDLKDELKGVGKYNKGNAIMTIFAGAGGDDAEDFASMLFNMYKKFFGRKAWDYFIIHENKNEHGGYRNLTIEISGKYSYGTLKNENGVHRLVRISPFNANKKRHTSFAMVEVIPKFEDIADFDISKEDLKIELSKSSGPGGQNVNKRETAVRVVHIPTNISVHIDSERTQERNKDKAISILKAKIFQRLEEEKKAKEEGMYISKTQEIEWGNQIRSYVLHPYRMVKDHRTGVETRDIDKVLKDGKIEEFLNSID